MIRTRQVTIDDMKQEIESLAVHAGTHDNRNHLAGAYELAKCCLDLFGGEFLTCEVALHICLICLRNSLDQSVSRDGQVLHDIIRNLALFIIRELGEAAALHLYDVGEADKLLVLTDRNLERSDLSSELLLQLEKELTEAGLVIIHVGHEDHARKVVLLAHIPCLDGTRLDACLAVYDDNGCICYAGCLFHFADKIKITRSIQDINFKSSVFTLELQRDHGSRNGKLSLDFFFIIIADRIPFRNASKSLGDAGNMCQCFSYRCLACAAVAKQDHITNLLCAVNIHLTSSCRF